MVWIGVSEILNSNERARIMKGERSNLQTNLVGRTVHLLTDEEARDEASKQESRLEPAILETVTAETWRRDIVQYKHKFGDQIGEIVAVHVADQNRLIYTISFGGQIAEISPELWRLDLP
jgi:hypothetical protein